MAPGARGNDLRSCERHVDDYAVLRRVLEIKWMCAKESLSSNELVINVSVCLHDKTKQHDENRSLIKKAGLSRGNRAAAHSTSPDLLFFLAHLRHNDEMTPTFNPTTLPCLESLNRLLTRYWITWEIVKLSEPQCGAGARCSHPVPPNVSLEDVHSS